MSFYSSLHFLGAPVSLTSGNGLGIVLFSFGLSILISLDDYRSAHEDSSKPDTVWALIAWLFRRQSLLFILVVAVATCAFVVYRITASLVSTEYTGGAGLLVRLPGKTIHYFPLSPYGWYNTGINLREGEKLEVEVTGQVSPGFLRHEDDFWKAVSDYQEFKAGIVKQRPPQPSDFQWPFTGPEGYPREWYKKDNPFRPAILRNHPTYKEDFAFETDQGLTVRGLPHNSVVGIVLPEGEAPRRAQGIDDPSYVFSRTGGRDNLIYLSAKRESYPLEVTAGSSGYLWMAINDADLMRWDNSGFFFVRLTRE